VEVCSLKLAWIGHRRIGQLLIVICVWIGYSSLLDLVSLFALIIISVNSDRTDSCSQRFKFI